MPKSFTIEQENLPEVVQGWLRAAQIPEGESVELVFTEGEVLLRRPTSPELREWATATVDRYDRAFRDLLGLNS